MNDDEPIKIQNSVYGLCAAYTAHFKTTLVGWHKWATHIQMVVLFCLAAVLAYTFTATGILLGLVLIFLSVNLYMSDRMLEKMAVIMMATMLQIKEGRKDAEDSTD